MRISRARLRQHEGLWDIEVDGGRIGRVAPAAEDPLDLDPEDVDAGGRLVVPPFVENHIHLDYAETAGQPRQNETGTLFEGIRLWAERKELGLHDVAGVKERALTAVRRAAGHGYGAIRTHVDVTDPELTGLHALLEVREEISHWMDLQIIAFPQNGAYAYPGGLELVERALQEGADVVGGIPHLEPTREDGVASVRAVFDLAEKYDVPVDIHCDEIDDPSSRFVEVMAAETTARGMQGRVTVAHAVAMGYYPRGYLDRLLPQLVEAGLGFAVCPNENLHLQGRGYGTPVPRGIAPVRTLTDWGLPVSFCQDSVGDPWYPLGASDALRLVESGLHVGHMLLPSYLDRALDFVTTHPARNLGLQGWEVAEGNPANLIILNAETEQDAVRFNVDVLLSLHEGREVFRRRPASTSWSV